MSRKRVAGQRSWTQGTRGAINNLITSEEDLKQAAVRLGEYIQKKKGTLLGTLDGVPIPLLVHTDSQPIENVAVGPVCSQLVSARNSREQGKIQGIYRVSGRRAVVQSAETAIPRQLRLAPCVALSFENRELTGNLPHSDRVPSCEFFNVRLIWLLGPWSEDQVPLQ
jgi:hypothetical protein